MSAPTPAGVALVAVWGLTHRAGNDPASYIRWLPNQWAFLKSQSKCKQIRQGNQWGGKTWAALCEVIGRCVGRHPLGAEGFEYPLPGPGFEAWIICDSWSQAVTIMGKLWSLLPKDEISPETVYEPTRGLKGKNPCVLFRNGAILRIKTANQDPKSLASGTIDVALFDEPPPSERVYTEVQARLQTKGGVLLLSYTPVNAPVAYLKQMVLEGKIEDHHSPLTPEALIPVGRTQPLRGPDGVLRDAAWIKEIRRACPLVQAPVVLDGEFEFRAVGAYFEGAWDGKKMVSAVNPKGKQTLCIGIDHGSRPGKQVCLLVAVDEHSNPLGPSVCVLDEYTANTVSVTPAEDAAGILAMLRRNGLEWGSLDHVFGDRVHMPGTGSQKSNKDLQGQVAKSLRVPFDGLRPEIRTVKRGHGHGAGSLGVGSRWLFHAAVQGRLTVNPRCTRLIEALPKYTMADDDFKDPIDALRYGLDSYIFRRNYSIGVRQ